MPVIKMEQIPSWVKQTSLPWSKTNDTYCVTIDTALYSPEAVLKTCYLFLDQCYLFVNARDSDLSEINVYFSQSDKSNDLIKIIGEFSNRLIWQEVHQKVANETQTIREIIVAQALTEGNILDHSGSEADYNSDPLDIAQ